jgi:hypothetical protein
LVTGGDVIELPLHESTRQWWQVVSSMPHCALWTPSDWEFAFATALVADAFFYGDRPSGARLAAREKVLGVTLDSRRDLRIRYVAPKAATDKPVQATGVTRIDDFRDRFGAGA